MTPRVRGVMQTPFGENRMGYQGTLADLESALRGVGYEPRREELLALYGQLTAPVNGVRVLFLEGPPGAGKTELARAIARAFSWPLIMGQATRWLDDRALFVDVNIGAVLRGDAESVDKKGLFWRIAEASQRGPVVGLLDELDKAQADAEDALLDPFQSGQIPVGPGEFVDLDKGKVLLIVTSNGVREHSDPFLRRVQRVRMHPLSPEKVDEVVVKMTGAPPVIVTRCRAAAHDIANTEGKYASPQEIANLVRQVISVAETAADVKILLAQWAAKTSRGAEAAWKYAGAAGIWSLVCERRRAS